MFAYGELQRWAGHTCMALVAALGMMGYHFANVRFVPVMAGFAIFAGVCYSWRNKVEPSRSLRTSGHFPLL